MLQQFFLLVRLAGIVCATCLACQAGERWTKITTSHFEMYTTESERDALRALQQFEQVRYFFTQTIKGAQDDGERVRIIAFSSEKAFKRYRPNEGVVAYYQSSHRRDYIVMQGIDSEYRQVAVHEYTHLFFRHLDLNLPIWLNEGMADLYSSLEPSGDRALVGRPLPGRAGQLSSTAWMDWNTLLAVDYSSPYYNEKNKMSMFYSQSWALAHMLALKAGYKQQFSKFFASVANGTDSVVALQQVYGKSVAAIDKDVQAYVQQATVQAALLDVKLSKQDLEPSVRTAEPLDVQLALADLQSAQPKSLGEAKGELLALAAQMPANAEVQESLAYLEWQQHQTTEAVKCFGAAYARGARRPKMLYDYATLLASSGNSADRVMEVLQQLLTIEPTNTEARLLYANTALRAQRYGAALMILAAVRSVKPKQAYEFFFLSASARANLHDLPGARAYAQKAMPYATDSGQRENIDNLLSYVDAEARAANNH
jgi:hypothetical protein